jgi:hypothetical protein
MRRRMPRSKRSAHPPINEYLRGWPILCGFHVAKGGSLFDAQPIRHPADSRVTSTAWKRSSGIPILWAEIRCFVERACPSKRCSITSKAEEHYRTFLKVFPPSRARIGPHCTPRSKTSPAQTPLNALLFDECIDERLRNSFPAHDCQTARFAGLAGLQNGELLAAAEAG